MQVKSELPWFPNTSSLTALWDSWIEGAEGAEGAGAHLSGLGQEEGHMLRAGGARQCDVQQLGRRGGQGESQQPGVGVRAGPQEQTWEQRKSPLQQLGGV